MLTPIDFDHTHFINLCHNFRTFAERDPTYGEMEEIYRLALLLDSYGQPIPPPQLHNFYVVSKCLVPTDVELALTDLETLTTLYAGLYEWDDDCFLVSSVTDAENGISIMEVNLLASFPNMVPLFIRTKGNSAFWEEFEKVYYMVF